MTSLVITSNLVCISYAIARVILDALVHICLDWNSESMFGGIVVQLHEKWTALKGSHYLTEMPCIICVWLISEVVSFT